MALTRDQIRRESLGEMGAWATDHIVHTSDQSVVLTTDEIWEAAKAAVPEASGDLVWGMTRRQLIDFLKLMLARIPHLAQTSDAVNRQLSCFSSRYMNLLAVFQI